MKKATRFDPETDPKVAEMRRAFERLEQAQAEADGKRADLERRATEARESAEVRQEKAEELERDIQTAFVGGDDDKAAKLRARQEGERRRAEEDGRKAETLKAAAEDVEPEIDGDPNRIARQYWIAVSKAIEQELRRVAGSLACAGALAYGRAHTSVSPAKFVEKAFDAIVHHGHEPSQRTVVRSSIGSHLIPSLGPNDHPIPRAGVLAALLDSDPEQRERAA